MRGLPNHTNDSWRVRLGVVFGKGSSSPPPAPDPVATSNAQAAANEQTARIQGVINHPNMVTPYGTQNWTLSGDQWNGVTTLSPEQQALYNSQTQAGQGLTDLANAQIPRLQSAMASGINTAGLPDPIALQGDIVNRANDVAKSLYDTGVARLQPQFDRQNQQTQQMLADRGIGAGSGDAWTNVNRDVAQQQNDALTQLSGQATQASGAEQNRLTQLAQSLRSGNISEQENLRSLPMQDIAQLLGTAPGTTQAQYPAPAPTQVAPTDVIGPIEQQYQSQVAAWQNQQRQQSQLLGGLFNLGGSALGGWASAGFPW